MNVSMQSTGKGSMKLSNRQMMGLGLIAGGLLLIAFAVMLW